MSVLESVRSLSTPLSSRLPPQVATKSIHSGDAPIRTNSYITLVVGVSDRSTPSCRGWRLPWKQT
jgi:hypothetical protein